MKKTWNVFSGIVWIVLIIFEVLLAATVLRLNMLPNTYLYLLFGLLVFAALLTALLVFKPKPGKRQKPTGHGRQIFGYILALLIIAGCAAATHVLSQVNNTISAVTELPVVTDIVNIYVRSDDPAQSLEDTEGYRFAVTESFDWENTQVTIRDLESQFGHELELVRYDSVPEMVDALRSGEVNAMILNGSYEAILEGLDGYSGFAEETKILAEHTIEQTVATEPSVPSGTNSEDITSTEATEATEPKEASVEEPFIIYLSGTDTRSSKLRKSNSDVNILAIVNPQTKQVLLVNTPRDYYLANPAGKGAMDKLTHHGIYGIQNSMETLGTLYDADIAYYAQINFTGFEKLIDAIGGVDVESVSSFSLGNDSYVKKGMNHFNGEQALAFARNRKSVSGGDNGRGKNQMRIITAVINKLSSGTTVITKYADILDSLKGMFVTNMTHEEISTLVKMQLTDMATWDVLSYAVTGTGGSDTNYSIGRGLHSYVMYPNQETVDHAVGLIDRLMAGETLTKDDLKVS